MEIIYLKHLLIEYLEKYFFFLNCRCEFHFFRREIDYTFFTLAFICRREIILVRKTVNKYICSLISIQKQFWLSHLLLHQRLPNRGETVSLHCGFGRDPLHTHPKRHEVFSSAHQSLRKDNNSDRRILSLERGLNLKACNQAILEANQCS